MSQRLAKCGLVAVACAVGTAGQGCGSAERGESTGGGESALGSGSVVISQVYGGGGNSGSKYKNDFIEIFNRSASPASLAGWSVQYASASGSNWSITALSGTVQPGHYYLVQEAAGSGGTTSLPAPDATGSTNMSLSSGKVALVNDTTALTCSTSCLPNSHVVDFVGYGSSASSFEGSGPTATLTNTTSASRINGGCTDADNNAGDFSAGTVNPRNSSSAANQCGGGDAGAVDSGTDAGVTDSGAADSGGADGGGTDSGGSDAGAVTLPAPTLSPITLPALTFGILGDTRPPNSQTSGYSSTLKAIIGSVFSGLQTQNVPFAVASGDYAFSSSSPGDALPQYHDYMTARANYSGTYLPTMGNHECNGFTNSNCPVGSYTGMTQDYINTIVTPATGQSSPYYSALYKATDGSWTAKFIFIAANAWDSTQNAWLQATLAVSTTYTFTIRHEPANDARAPGVTPSENMMSSSFGAGRLTLSITGHTHLVQLAGGTQPYGDPFGATQAYEIIIGNGGAPLDSGPTYGYAVATRRASDGAIVTQLYESANSSGNPIVPNVADTNFRFAVNPNGTPNGNTTLP